MTIPTISALPTAPSRDDPATFADRADAMVSALPTMVTQINAATAAIPAEIDALALDAAADATAPYTSAAAASAVSAAAARDLSIAAWAASMAPAETLPAISQSLHIGAVVAAKIYDTSKDSDGGAWRKRCQHASWYSEALGGNRWIGQQASIAAAWTAAGSTTGAVFQASATAGPLTIGKYYAATSGTTATEVFRGVKAEFPAVVAVVAETGRVVIYDMTLPVPAMWMVFVGGSGRVVYAAETGSLLTSVACANGQLLVGANTNGGLGHVDFARDYAYLRIASTVEYNGSNIANRNQTRSDIATGTTVAIVNRNVNSIAAAVLPDAPIDPATGLAVPTIAVATLGGASVIKSDGSVVNSAQSPVIRLSVYGESLWSDNTSSGSYLQVVSLKNIAAGFAFINVSTPWSVGPPGAGSFTSVAAAPLVSKGTNVGCVRLAHNPATPTKGMVAYITAAYPGMWQVGDSKRAWLCDATAETVTGGTQPDRSVKNKPITVNGSLTKTMVGGVATYNGFSASNYLEEAYSSDLDFGTGDFCIIGWQLLPNFSMPFAAVHRSLAASSGGVLVQTSTTSGEIVIYMTASSTFTAIGSSMQSTAGVWQMIAYVRRAGVLEAYLDGRLQTSVANTTNITYANAVTRVGARLDSPNAPGHSLSLWRLGATAPSADQIAQIYRDELAIFQTGAVGTLAGSSSAVTALDYDDSTDLLHIGTSTHRSAFRGLTRVSSEATPAGTITSLSASGGAVLTGGTSGYLYQPALLLRDEIKRRDEARRALGKEVVFFDYDAVTSQVAFVLPKGYTTKAVYSAGTLKRLGSAKDYTTSFDGYVETATFGAAPGNTVWVSIMAVRSS